MMSSRFTKSLLWGGGIALVGLMLYGGRAFLPWQKVGIWSTVTRTAMGRSIAAYAGESRMMAQQVEDEIAQLQDEIRRLQWIEAESDVVAERLAAEIDARAVRLTELKHDLLLLTAQAKAGTAAVLSNGQEVSPAENPAVYAQYAAQVEQAEEQLALYAETYQVYLSTRQRARGLWQEAAQNIVTMRAYLLLFQATAHDDATASADATPEDVKPPALQALEQQMERNRRIRELRQGLAEQMAQ